MSSLMELHPVVQWTCQLGRGQWSGCSKNASSIPGWPMVHDKKKKKHGSRWPLSEHLSIISHLAWEMGWDAQVYLTGPFIFQAQFRGDKSGYVLSLGIFPGPWGKVSSWRLPASYSCIAALSFLGQLSQTQEAELGLGCWVPEAEGVSICLSHTGWVS